MAQASISRSLSPLKLSFSWGFQAELSWHNTTLLMVASNFGVLDGVEESRVRLRRSLRQMRAS